MSIATRDCWVTRILARAMIVEIHMIGCDQITINSMCMSLNIWSASINEISAVFSRIIRRFFLVAIRNANKKN